MFKAQLESGLAKKTLKPFRKLGEKNVKKIIIKIVIIINVKFVFISKFEDENTLGIIIKIEKGFNNPPVRYSKKLN